MISMTLPQYRRHECSVDGRSVRLWPVVAETLAILLVSNPSRFVSRNDLIEALWPNPDLEPEWATTMIDRFIHILRRSGVTIERAYGFGWRIPKYARTPVDIGDTMPDFTPLPLRNSQEYGKEHSGNTQEQRLAA